MIGGCGREVLCKDQLSTPRLTSLGEHTHTETSISLEAIYEVDIFYAQTIASFKTT